MTNPLRILLIDDHALVRDGLQLVLQDLPPSAPHIVEAGSLEHARARLNDGAFDLVLLDYILPDTQGGSGLQALLEVAGETPIVIMSSECESELVRSALAAGARGFVPKKSPAKLLLAALMLVLSGGIYVPPDALPAPTKDGPNLSLTGRQRDVLQLLVDGRTNKEIAGSLGTSESTVRVHLHAIFRTLGVENRTQACSVAIRKQLVRRPSA